MSAELTIFGPAMNIALILVSGLTLLCSYRVIKGPTTPDRVVALDTIGTNIVAIAVLYGLVTGQGLFAMIALMLAIIGFVSTVSVSMYIDEGDIIE